MHSIFGNNIPANTQAPFFGGHIYFEKLSLSESGQQIARNILCIIAHNYPNLNYSPMIPSITAILCHHMSSYDALGCLISMIKDKREDCFSFFPLHSRDFLVFVRVFEGLVKTYVPNVLKHVKKIEGIDNGPDWERLLSNFFTDIFPLSNLMRIMDCFIVEKYKILFRFALAHIILLETELLRAKSIEEFDEILFLFRSDINFEELYKTAFSLKISRRSIWASKRRQRKLSIGDFDVHDRVRIFHKPLPHLTQPSSFLRDNDLMMLWNWIPSRYKLMNLQLLFSSSNHGYHLSTLYQKTQSNEPLLILIEDTHGCVFGAYASKSLSCTADKKFYGTGETFLFTLKPQQKKYAWDATCDNYSFIMALKDMIAFGAGPQGHGLCVDQNLEFASTSHCSTYENDPLCKQDSKPLIVNLELFSFH